MLVIINNKALKAEKISRIEIKENKIKGVETYSVVALVRSFNNYTQDIVLGEFNSLEEAKEFIEEAVNKINEAINKNNSSPTKLEIVEVYIDGDNDRDIYNWILNVLPIFSEEFNNGKTPEWENNQLKVCGIKIEKDPDRDFLTIIGEKEIVEGLINKMRESYLECMRTQFDDMFSGIKTIYERGEECL